ncbi:MAG: T9SS type A sorting domain-containing protein [Bacteroidia bacterium]|nr:T9SS type A sorting domain-containing protein [Bacteroidia bacterium]
MKKIFTIILLINILYFNSFSQNNLCNLSDPFCTGTTYNFPAGVNQGSAQSGPNYGCLGSEPNPVWFYLLIYQSGNIQLEMHTVPQHDVDFVCWGPFTSQTTPCTSQLTATGPTPSHYDSLSSPDYPAGNMIDCGYNSSYQEWCYIPNTQTGQYYILMITNYSNQACNIVMTQSNIGHSGAGSTDCGCKCPSIIDMSHNSNPCNPLTNQYSVNGNLIFYFYAGNFVMTGSVVIVDQPSGITQTIDGPFTNSSSPLNYHLDSIPSDGLQHTITATFSDAPTLTYYISYAAPEACNFTSIKSYNNLLLNDLSVFPNPASNGKFEINYSSNYFDDITIRIISIEGKDIFKSQLTKNTEFIKIPVDIGNNNKGYYIVELISGQNVCRKSILIQ